MNTRVIVPTSGIHDGPGYGHHRGPFRVYVAEVDFSDYTASAQTEALALTDFPANVIPVFAMLNLGTEFAGGLNITAAAVELGDTGDPNGLVLSTDVFTAAGTGWKFPGAAAEAGTFQGEAAFAPKLLMTVGAGETVDNFTSGAVTVRIYFVDPINDLP